MYFFPCWASVVTLAKHVRNYGRIYVAYFWSGFKTKDLTRWNFSSGSSWHWAQPACSKDVVGCWCVHGNHLKVAGFFSLVLVSFSCCSVFTCCSLVRGCCSQMETAEMITTTTNHFRPCFFFFFTGQYALKTFSDLSGAVFLWCNLGHR